jgi:hypothetical protein
MLIVAVSWAVNYLFTCDGVFVGILCEVIFSGNNTQRK